MAKFLKLIYSIKPDRFFIIAAVFFELLFTWILPPLHCPDETNHFYRAWQISKGSFLPQKENNRVGSKMPYVFRWLPDPFMKNVSTEFFRATAADKKKLFEINVNDKEEEFKDFPNTAYYCFVSYIPQSAALFVLRQFNAPLGVLYYGGRLAILLVWLFAMTWAIRILPGYKWLFTLLVLLPMDMYVSNSYSADTVTNILSFVWLALILRLIFGHTRLQRKEAVTILVVALLLALAKIVYVVLVLLLLAVPVARYASTRAKWLFTTGVFFVAFTAAYWWSSVIMSYYTPFSAYNPDYRVLATVTEGSNYHLQKEYIMTHWSYFLKVIYTTLTSHPGSYLSTYVAGFGTSLYIFFQPWMVVATYLVIGFFALTEHDRLVFKAWQTGIVLLTAGGTFVALLLSQHLTWDDVGSPLVHFIQGRYLIPILPLLFILLGSIRLKVNAKVQLPVILFSVLISSYATWLLYGAYIRDYGESKIEFYCGAEEVDENGLFKTSDAGIRLQGGQNRVESEHRTGKYSVMVGPGSPFAFTYMFKNLGYLDLVEVDAWEKGEGGEMVVSGRVKKSRKDCNDFYFVQKETSYREKNGWSRIHMVFSRWDKCDSSEVGFYLFNQGTSSVYFDDLTFKVKKFRDYYKDLHREQVSM